MHFLGLQNPSFWIDLAFIKEVSEFIVQAINCQLKIISPCNHSHLRAEEQIQTIGKMITKHLTGKVEVWPLYLVVAA